MARSRTAPASASEAKHVREDRPCRSRIAKEQADTMKATDRLLRRHCAAAPCRVVVNARHGDYGESHSVRVFKREHRLAETLLDRQEQNFSGQRPGPVLGISRRPETRQRKSRVEQAAPTRAFLAKSL